MTVRGIQQTGKYGHNRPTTTTTTQEAHHQMKYQPMVVLSHLVDDNVHLMLQPNRLLSFCHDNLQMGSDGTVVDVMITALRPRRP
jgi:hypothetical protein